MIGYLHTGFEKNMEHKTWWKCITYPERIDYVSFQNNEYVFVARDREAARARGAARRRRGCARCLCELNRIHSHLVWLGTARWS